MKHVLSHVGYMATDTRTASWVSKGKLTLKNWKRWKAERIKYCHWQQLVHWSVTWLRACRILVRYFHCLCLAWIWTQLLLKLILCLRRNSWNSNPLVYYALLIQWLPKIRKNFCKFQNEIHYEIFLLDCFKFKLNFLTYYGLLTLNNIPSTIRTAYITEGDLFQLNFFGSVISGVIDI